MYLRIWRWDAISTYLLYYSGKLKEMVLDTLVRRCLSFCFPLFYSIGLQVGLQTCNVGLQPECVGLQPLALASNLGCLVCLVFLVTNLLAMALNLPSMASNLRARTSNFDGFTISILVANLLAMAPQPAFDGLQPKSEGLQL